MAYPLKRINFAKDIKVMLRQVTALKMVPFITHITTYTIFCFIFNIGLAFRTNKWHRFRTFVGAGGWGDRRGWVKAEGKLGLGS